MRKTIHYCFGSAKGKLQGKAEIRKSEPFEQRLLYLKQFSIALVYHEKIYDPVLDGIIYDAYPIQIQGKKSMRGEHFHGCFPCLHSNLRLFQRNV